MKFQKGQILTLNKKSGKHWHAAKFKLKFIGKKDQRWKPGYICECINLEYKEFYDKDEPTEDDESIICDEGEKLTFYEEELELYIQGKEFLPSWL